MHMGGDKSLNCKGILMELTKRQIFFRRLMWSKKFESIIFFLLGVVSILGLCANYQNWPEAKLAFGYSGILSLGRLLHLVFRK